MWYKIKKKIIYIKEKRIIKRRVMYIKPENYYLVVKDAKYESNSLRLALWGVFTFLSHTLLKKKSFSWRFMKI